MKHALTVLLVLLPATVLAGPSIVIEPKSKPQIRYVRQYEKTLPPKPSAEDMMRAFEEREIMARTPKPKPLTAEEAEALIERKNQELVEKIKESQGASATIGKEPEKKEEKSAIGKVGGLGTVGGLGPVGK